MICLILAYLVFKLKLSWNFENFGFPFLFPFRKFFFLLAVAVATMNRMYTVRSTGYTFAIPNSNLTSTSTLTETPKTKTPPLSLSRPPTDPKLIPAFPPPPFPRKPQTHHPNPPHAPRILLANCTSFCIMVTRLAWMAHRFVSSNRWTRKASQLSCRAWMAWDCHRRDSPPVGTRDSAISRTYINEWIEDVRGWGCAVGGVREGGWGGGGGGLEEEG